MGRSRFRFGESPIPYFLTCTVVGWLPVFTRPDTVQILLDSWRFLQDQERLTLLGYVVLENHIHFIASAADLGKEVGDFKSYTARRIIDYLRERQVRTLLDGLEYHKARHKGDRAFQLWQEGSHQKVIETEEVLRQNSSTSTRTLSNEGTSAIRRTGGIPVPGIMRESKHWFPCRPTGDRSRNPTRSVQTAFPRRAWERVGAEIGVSSIYRRKKN